MLRPLALVLAVAVAVAADVATHSNCEDGSGEQCSVSQVRVSPCREAPGPCRLKKGRDATISFDYSAKFSAQRLKMSVAWVNGVIDVPFDLPETDGCKFTSCPTQPDQPASYNFTMHIGRKLPTSTFTTKWKVANEEDASQACCFLTDITLYK